MNKIKTVISKVLCLIVILLSITPMKVEAKVTNDIGYQKIFNAVYYADRYPDLKNAYGYNTGLLYNHFLNYGMCEGRDAHPEFSVRDYKNNYNDLQTAFGNNLEKYYEHFILYGINEGRYSGVDTDYWNQQSINNASSTSVNDVSIVAMDGVGAGSVDTVRYYLNMLPNHYLRSFIDNGWRIEIHSSLGSNEWGNIGGITYTGENLIKLRADSINWAILHEFGHFIDDIKRGNHWWLSESDEFMSIYNSEAGKCGLSRYYTKDPVEYFAECFRYSYEKENIAIKKFPNTYNFIRGLENQ